MQIRVIVRIDESNEELVQHLLEVPARRRAARLRTLATIGLMKSTFVVAQPDVQGNLTKGAAGLDSRFSSYMGQFEEDSGENL